MPEILGTSKSIWGFDPRTIPGCALWLDGADSNATTQITSGIWKDKSIYASNALSNTVGTTSAFSMGTINGIPAVTFPAASASAFIANVALSTATGFSMFFIANHTATSGVNPRYLSAGSAGATGDVQVYASNTAFPYVISTYVAAAPSSLSLTVSKNSPFVYSGTVSSTAVNFWVNGNSNSGNPTAPVSSVTTWMYIGNYGYSTGSPSTGSSFTGQMGEVILYNQTLTTAQRQQVEGYLAWKWGLNTFVNPTSIPNLALWLDANDSTSFNAGSITTGTAISNWSDKSGRANHAVQATAGNRPTYQTDSGYPSVFFSSASSQYMFGASNSLLTSKSVSIFIVGRTTSTPSQYVFFDYKVAGQNYVQILIDPLNAGGNWVGGAQYTINNPTTTSSSFAYQNGLNRTMITYLDDPSNTASYYGNGSLLTATLTGTNAGNVATDAGGYALGTLRNPGSSVPGGTYFQGYMYEVIVYLNTVSSAQRQAIEGYLGNKWGISGPSVTNTVARTLLTIPSTHPFYTTPTFSRVFQPVDIDGCSLWLDAMDSSTFTFSSGSNVSTWKDKSGNGNKAVSSSGTVVSGSNINGFNSLYFPAQAQLVLQTSTSTSTFTTGSNITCFVVAQGAQALPGSSGAGYFFITTDNNSATAVGPNWSFYYVTSFNASPFLGYRMNVTEYQCLGVGLSTTSPGVFCLQPQLPLGTVNGTTYAGNGAASLPAGSYNTCLGGIRGDSYPFKMGEVIIYNSSLTTAQRQQVEGYLAAKWNLAPVAFRPTAISGLQLWLDAQDASTVTTSAGLVTNVADKSGSNWVLSGANGFSYPNNTFNGSYPSFYGSNPSNSWTLGSSLSFTVSQPFTVFFVGARPNLATATYAYNGYVFDGTNSTNRCYMYGNYYVAGALGTAVTLPLDTTQPVVVTTIYNTTNSSQYLDGVAFNTGSNIGTANLSAGIRIGNDNGPGTANAWVGHFCEFLIYSRVLSTTERQQVEYYLASKWGILTTDTFTPKMIPNCTLWFDAADTTTVTLTASTNNIASWKSKDGAAGVTASAASGTLKSGLTTVNGLNVVNVPQSAYLSFALATPNQGRAWFIVTRNTTQLGTTGQGWIPISSTTTGSREERLSLPCFSSYVPTGYAASLYQPGSADMVKTNFNLGNPLNTWAIYTFINSGVSSSSNLFAIDGVSQILATSLQAISPQAYRTTSYTRTIGSGPGDATTCDIGEIIMYNGEITTSQRLQVEYYLANKWGITTWNRFLPNMLSNCLVWLDAADTTTIASTANVVSAWSNKGRWQGTASTGSGSVSTGLATYNGSNILGQPTSAYLSMTLLAIPNQAYAWFIVRRPTYQQPNSYSNQIINPVPASGNVVTGPESATDYTTDTYRIRVGLNGGSTLVQTTNTVPSGYNTMNIYTIINSAVSTSSNYIGVNGTSYALGTSALASGYPTASSTYNIGGNGNNTSDFAEVILINDEVTTTQRRQIEYYLSQKWNIPITPISTFTPVSLPACALWLDAADATTLSPSGVGTGSSVTQWNDKSGNNRHAVGYNNTATYAATGLNGRPALTFSSTKSMAAPVPAGTFPTAVSTFVVYQFSGVANAGSVYTIINRTLASTSNLAAPFSMYEVGGTDYRYIGNGGTTTGRQQVYGTTTGTLYTTITPTVYYFNIQSNAPTTWNESVNGTTATYTLANSAYGGSGYADTGTQVCIGGRLDTGVFMNGVISEVIMYNTTLTTAQRLQVESYLSKKWGISGPPAADVLYGPSATTFGPSSVNLPLTSALPTTHSFATFPPATSQPPQYQDVTVGNWTRDWQPYLSNLAAANSSGVTVSFNTTTVTGAASGTAAYGGGVLAPNGNIYCIPNSATAVGLINTTTNTFSSSSVTGTAAGSGAYTSGVLAPNGKIYCIPYNTTLIGVIDPTTNTFSTFGTAAGGYAYASGVLAPNGLIYCIPYNATTIGVINPATNTFSTFGSLASGGLKYTGGVLAPNGKIYCIPDFATTIGVIDPTTNTFSTFGTSAGSDAYIGGVLVPNGLIYCIPAGGTTSGVGVINPTTNTFSTFGTAPGNAAYYGGVLGPDGNIYCIPFKTTTNAVGKITPSSSTFSSTSVSGSLGTTQAYIGGVLAPNGNIYCIPYKATAVGVISFSGLSQRPSSNYCLSAYTNKF